jgi:RecA/RadA recombinase
MGAAEAARLAIARRVLADASGRVGVVPAGHSHGAARVRYLPTGLAALDALLGGGLERGQLVELTGAAGSGRLALTLHLLGQATQQGEPVALVDVADALNPDDLEASLRPRVLWVRPQGMLASLQAVDLLLDAGGFSLVVLYLVGATAVGQGRRERVATTAWARLARRAESTRTTLLAVTDGSAAQAPGSFASMVLGVEGRRVRWVGGRNLLEGVEGEIVLVRSRRGRGVGRAVPFALGAP